MFITLKRSWDFFLIPDKNVTDGVHRRYIPTNVWPGRYEVERINNPYGYDNSPWLIIKNTKVGLSEKALRLWAGSRWGDLEVVVEDDTPQVETIKADIAKAEVVSRANFLSGKATYKTDLEHDLAVVNHHLRVANKEKKLPIKVYEHNFRLNSLVPLIQLINMSSDWKCSFGADQENGWLILE